MVPRIKWAKRSVGDLKDIYNFIEKDSPRFAQIQVEKIQKSVLKLKNYPQIGRILPEFPKLNYRELLIGIIYRFEKDKKIILILSVIHGTCLLKKDLL